jgi:hypothetical protein
VIGGTLGIPGDTFRKSLRFLVEGKGGGHSRNQPDREEIGGIESTPGGTGITISVSTHA